MKRPILEKPFITATGKTLDGVELVTYCDLWLCNVNVKKNCGKCLSRNKISYKDKYVDCKYEKRQ